MERPNFHVIVSSVILLVALVMAAKIMGFLERPLIFAEATTSQALGRRLSAQDSRWQKSDRTLVLVLRRGCHFCEESMPFYRKLSQLRSKNQIKANIVAEFPDDEASVRFLMKSQNLSFEAVPNVPTSQLLVDGTPTAMLVDRKGDVLQTWDGRLSTRQEEALVTALER